MNFKDYIASIPDFPQEGVLFRDITPLMADGKAFQEACDKVIDFARSVQAEVIVGPESRGFIFGCPVAYELGAYPMIWNTEAMSCTFTGTASKKGSGC